MSAPSPGGAVAAGDTKTSEAGASVLRAGGNAVDAAVAAVLASFSSEPVLTGPYGGGFAVVAGPGAEPSFVDFFADAPGRGLADVRASGRELGGLDFRGLDIGFGATTQTFHCGRGSVAVPSMLEGLVALQRRHGALPLGQVAAPAVALARDGAPVSAALRSFIEILQPILRLSAPALALFSRDGELLRRDQPFVSPDLAALLERVAAGGPTLEPAGFLGEFGPPRGRVTAGDLEQARGPVTRQPLRVRLGRYEVLLNPPPASGGLLIAFALKLLERVPARVWHDDVARVMHLTAAMAVSNAARAEVLDAALEAAGDDPAEVAGEFLADDHVDRWRGHFEQAALEGPAELAPAGKDLGSTTHVSAIDARGLACAITSSNGEGCGFLVPGAGAMANNFMGEEDLHPAGFFTRRPGRRLTSMMSPTIVLRDGEPDVVLGTGGSNRIRSAILQVVVHRVLRGLSIDEAVRAPRLHYEGNCLYCERRGPGTELSPAAIAALTAHVHEVVVFEEPAFYFGGVHAADRQGNAIGDPRRGGAVARA